MSRSLALVAAAIGSAGAVAGAAAASGETVEVDLGGTLPAGKSLQIFFTVTVDDPLPAGVTSVSTQGVVTGDDFADVLTDDPGAPGAEDPTTTSVVAAADLTGSTVSVEDASGDGLAGEGETLTWTIAVTNSGNQGAAAVVITDAAPASTTFVDASVAVVDSSGASGVQVVQDTGSLQVDVAELDGGGGFVRVSFATIVDATVPAGVLTIADAAELTADGVPAFATGSAEIPIARALSGRAWYDRDQDGVQDGAELGLVGLTVEVLDDGSCAGSPLGAPTATDDAGAYAFAAVAAGTRCVRLSGVPATWSPSPTDQTSEDLDSDGVATADPSVVVIPELDLVEELTDEDFGLFAAGSISGLVWCDREPGNGTPDPDEGLADVAVTLFAEPDCSGGPSAALATIDTGADGGYAFTDLVTGPPSSSGPPDPECYFVRAEPTDPDLAACDTPITPVFAALELDADAPDVTGVDFGFAKPDSPTAVLVTDFALHAGGGGDGGVVVAWETAFEAGTLGWQLLRRAAAGTPFAPVHAGLLPGAGAPQGGVYRFRDPSAPRNAVPEYLLVEVEPARDRLHGPFTATVAGVLELDGDYAATARSVPSSAGSTARAGAPAPLGLRDAGPTRSAPPVLEPRVEPTLGVPLAADALVLGVRTEGVHGLATDTLAAALGRSRTEIEAALAAGDVALTRRGEPVAWTPTDDGLAFYGVAPDGIFAPESAYRLTLAPGLVMEPVRGFGPTPVAPGSFTSEVRFEERRFALTKPALVGPEEDFWFWETLHADGPSARASFVLPLDDVANGGEVRLTAHLHGASETAHHAVVSVGGVELGEALWSGSTALEASFAFSTELLADGAATAELEARLRDGEPFSLFHVDAFTLAYPRRTRAADDRLRLTTGADAGVVSVDGFTVPDVAVYRVDDPARPRVVEAVTVDRTDTWRVSFVAEPDAAYELGAAPLRPTVRVDVAAGLRERAGAAHVVVVPSELLPAARRLAEHRRAQGLSSIVVDLVDVYDEFAHGEATPHAVRDFLAHAWSEWAEPPRYAVLVGSGSYDYRDVLGAGDNLVPPLLVTTRDGLFAADVPLGDVSGDDGVPEIAVGRIPARTADDVEAFVAKLITAETAAAFPPRVLLLADDADAGGDFPAASEAVATLVDPDADVARVYLSELDVETARAALFAELDAGVAWVNFVGHGGVDRLTGEGLLTAADVAELANPVQPFVSALTCAAGEFEIPAVVALAEELVLHPTGGATAVLAPTALSRHASATVLDESLAAALFGDGHERLGDALRAAAAAYARAGHPRTLLEVTTLFGDPAQPVPGRP